MPLSAALAVLALSLLAPARAQSPENPGSPKHPDCADPAVSKERREKLGCPPSGAHPAPKTAAALKPAPVSGANVAALGGLAASPNEQSLGRAFDGGGGAVEDGVASVAALKAQPASPAGRFSAAFNAKLSETISSLPQGRRALDRLNDAKGEPSLPRTVIVDLGGGSVPAQFDRFGDQPTLQLDRGNLAEAALKAAPPAERAALARRWKDPQKLAEDLTARPALMAAVADGFDGVVVHEYTHAWQSRRDRPIDLSADSNREPVEWEVEAYREEMLYFHQKLLRDSSLIDRAAGDADTYKSMLAGYDEFRGRVVALYQGLANGSFPRLEKALARRAGGAAKAAGVKAVADEYDAREKAFGRDVLPTLQSEGYAALLKHYTASGRPDKALGLLVAAPGDMRARSGPAALSGTIEYLKKDPPAAVDDRLDAWQSYLAYLVKTTGSNSMPNDLFALYQRDYRAAYDAKVAEASAAASPKARREALSWARGYAQFLPSPEKERLLRKLDGGRK